MMQFFTGLLLAAAAVQAHCMFPPCARTRPPGQEQAEGKLIPFTDTFPRLVINGKAEEKDWSVTRMTKNAQSKQGIENPTSGDIRCYTSQTASNVATVPAGSTIHYISTQQINHPGPTQYYLAKVPAGSSAKTFDGSGAVWFKFATAMPTMDSNRQMVWPGQSESPS
jgi:hypothetical protein